MSGMSVRVLLVDDDDLMRAGLRAVLSSDASIEVVGEAADGRSAIEGISETRPAAVLLDLSMPDMDGFEAIPEIRNRVPEIAIVILSGFSADRMGDSARERGADGYVEKGTSIAELRRTTRRAVSARRGG